MNFKTLTYTVTTRLTGGNHVPLSTYVFVIVDTVFPIGTTSTALSLFFPGDTIHTTTNYKNSHHNIVYKLLMMYIRSIEAWYLPI